MATTPVFQLGPKTTSVTVADTDTTLEKTLYTAGALGALVDSVAITSTDTSPVVLNVHVSIGGTSLPVAQIVVAALAGTDGTTPAQNLLNSLALPFLQSSGSLALGPNVLLRVAADATITAGKKVELTAFGGDY